MSEFPKMLFRKGTADDAECHDLHCQTMIANDADEAQAALSEGWAITPHEAHGVTPVPPKTDVPEQPVTASDDVALLQEVDDLRRQTKAAQEAALAAQSKQSELFDELQQLRDERDALQAERDELKELMAVFDADNNGKPGGSRPKAKAA